MQSNLLEGVEDNQDILPAIISDMANDSEGRSLLIIALNKNGVSIDDSDNRDLYAAVYTALATSKTFKLDLKRAIFTYLKQDDDDQLNLTAEERKKRREQKRLARQERRAKGEKTAAGKFLSSIVTSENAQALTNFAVNLVSSRLENKANAEALNEGIDYQVARTTSLEKEKELEEQRARWVVPVVVASSLIVVSIIGYLIYKNVKSKNK